MDPPHDGDAAAFQTLFAESAPSYAAHHPAISRGHLGELYALTKRPHGVFPARIGLGRARNLDVRLRFPEISKYHAYLQRDEVGRMNPRRRERLRRHSHQPAPAPDRPRKGRGAWGRLSAPGASVSAMSDFASGHIVAERYRLISLLGQGAMGAVRKAESLHTRHLCALKILK